MNDLSIAYHKGKEKGFKRGYITGFLAALALLALMSLFSGCYCTRATMGDVIVHSCVQFQSEDGPYYRVIAIPVGGWKMKEYHTQEKYFRGDTVPSNTLNK